MKNFPNYICINQERLAGFFTRMKAATTNVSGGIMAHFFVFFFCLFKVAGLCVYFFFFCIENILLL